MLPALDGYLRTENPRGDGIYYWPHLGLSFVELVGRIDSVRSGTNAPSDAGDLRYETVDGIGRGGSPAEITREFGDPEQTRPEQRFAKATHRWVYQSRGIAFSLDDEQRIRIVDVLKPVGQHVNNLRNLPADKGTQLIAHRFALSAGRLEKFERQPHFDDISRSNSRQIQATSVLNCSC